MRFGPVACAFAAGACTRGEIAISPLPPACPAGTPPLFARPIVTFPDASPRRVLMLSVDTLRTDRVGRYGGSGLTPFLDGLLEQSVALDAHVSCSNWTLPSATCALTGRTVIELGAFPFDKEVPDVDALATILSAAGYRTGLVSGNAYVGPEHATGDDYDEATLFAFADRADVLLGEAELMLDRLDASGLPWLAHVHLTDPHAPYDPPVEVFTPTLDRLGLDARSWSGVDTVERIVPTLPPADRAGVERELRALYDAEVRSLDDQLAAFFATADARGWLDDTLVVVWSDHGEQFWEHGAFRHGNQLFDEESAAIAAFWAKDLQPVAWGARTGHLDLLPTVLVAIGLPVPPDLTGAPVGFASPDRPVIAYRSSGVRAAIAITRREDRLVLYWSDTPSALYDLAADPLERDPDDTRGSPIAECLEAHAAEPIDVMSEKLGRRPD